MTCLGCLHAKSDPDRNILCSWVWKNVEFCTWAASNSSHVALSQQHLLSFLNLVATAKITKIH